MKKTIKSKIGLAIVSLFLLSSFVALPFANRINGNFTFKKIYTEETKVVVDEITDCLIQNDMNKIIRYFPENNENVEEGLNQIKEYLSSNPIEEIELVNVNKTKLTSTSGNRVNELYQFQTKHKEKFEVLTIQTTAINNDIELRNLNINPMENDLIETNSFFKEEMGLQRISLIVTGLLLNIFVLVTVYHYFIKCNNPKLLRIILLSISIIFVSFNWNTMNKTYNLISFSLNPFSIFRSGNVGIWQLKLYTPLFSVLYWVTWKDKFINSERILKKKKKQVEIEETV